MFAILLALSSSFVVSCDDEDDGQTQNKGQVVKRPETYDIPTGVQVSYVKSFAGDCYVIENETLGLKGVSVSVVKVEGSYVTVNVSGTTLTVADNADYESCVMYSENPKRYFAANLMIAETDPQHVVFVCQDICCLVTGTESNSEIIRQKAGKTTFEKWDDKLEHDFSD